MKYTSSYIKLDSINIYFKYNGDCDMWARSELLNEKDQITDEDWYDILMIVQRLDLIKKGLTNKSFEEETEKILSEQLDCIEGINKLKVIA